MSKDKEFKAKNREQSYIKEKASDMKLGRHNQAETTVSTSKKNRLYQEKSAELEKPLETADNKYSVSESMVSDTVNTQNEKSVHIKNDIDTQDSFSENADSNTENMSADTNNFHLEKPTANEISRPAEQTKKIQRQQAQKFRQENNSVVSEIAKSKIPVDTETHKDVPIPPPLQQNDKYNIREAAENTESAFDRVNGNTDFQLGQSEPSSPPETKTQTDKGIKFRNKNRLYQEGHKKADDNPQSVSSQQGTENAESDSQFNFENTENTDVSENKTADIPETDDFQFKRTRYEKKADKAKSKSAMAQNKLPHKKKIKRQRIYDEQKQKGKNRLQFEKETLPQKDMYHRNPVKSVSSAAGYGLLNKAHTKISEVESDNTAVESAHKAEQKAERLTQYSIRTQKAISQNRKNAPYKKAARLRYKAEKAEIKAMYEKTLADNPELKKSAVKKFIQKQRIKKKYQKAKRAEQTARKAKKSAQNTEKAASRLAAFVWRHKAVFGVIIAFVLLIAWLGSVLSSCSVMGTTGANSLMVSSYFSEDSDIYASENYYVGLEQNLQSKIDNVERTYPNYDEYNYSLAGIGHNPYELISYLTAMYEDFKFNDVKPGLDELFNRQYHLRITETSQQRTRDDGSTYTYKILNVALLNNGIANALTADKLELYNIYLASKGNRDYLFAGDIYSNVMQSPYNDYTIPGEALTDATFRTLITEAEKYLGYPYVWGGSSPSTSFDCSGFVCYVFTHSGIYNLGRTTAQGIFDKCTAVRPSDAKPGDIIFFTGTYNSGCPVSHVGIYVGNNMMIHCGNPIQYASVNSSYWQSHFYAYGRIGGD